jgi:hypothetical protein
MFYFCFGEFYTSDILVIVLTSTNVVLILPNHQIRTSNKYNVLIERLWSTSMKLILCMTTHRENANPFLLFFSSNFPTLEICSSHYINGWILYLQHFVFGIDICSVYTGELNKDFLHLDFLSSVYTGYQFIQVWCRQIFTAFSGFVVIQSISFILVLYNRPMRTLYLLDVLIFYTTDAVYKKYRN